MNLSTVSTVLRTHLFKDNNRVLSVSKSSAQAQMGSPGILVFGIFGDHHNSVALLDLPFGPLTCYRAFSQSGDIRNVLLLAFEVVGLQYIPRAYCVSFLHNKAHGQISIRLELSSSNIFESYAKLSASFRGGKILDK